MATMTWCGPGAPPGLAAATGHAAKPWATVTPLEHRTQRPAMTKEVRENHERDD
jgi:hypothetical protein